MKLLLTHKSHGIILFVVMKIKSPKEIAEEIIKLYTDYGDEDYIGEPVSQIEHMAQCAALAIHSGYDDEVVLGAFFHDVGHLCAHGKHVGTMDGYGNIDHERLGAEFLRSYGFSERVLMMVQGHVQAKRYLTFKDAGYLSRLSEASRQTLIHQGGVMSKEEAEDFERLNDADLLIKLRQWDDEAKQIDIPVTILAAIRAMIIRHLTGNIRA